MTVTVNEVPIGQTKDFSDVTMNSPLPVANIWPAVNYMAVEPVGIESVTTGGIIKPDAVKDLDYWLQGSGRVLAMGQGCFKGDIWRRRGVDENTRLPVVGDCIEYSAKAALRKRVAGHVVVLINDTDWLGFIKPEELHLYEWI